MNTKDYFFQTIQDATDFICRNLQQACQEIIDLDAGTVKLNAETLILAQAASKIPWLEENAYAIRSIVANAAIRTIAKCNAASKEKAIEALKAEQQNADTECAHANADGVLCELLASLGYKDVVDEFSKVDKWYA